MSKTLEAASEFSNQSFFCFVADLVELFVESVKDAVKDRQKRGIYQVFGSWRYNGEIRKVRTLLSFNDNVCNV